MKSEQMGGIMEYIWSVTGKCDLNCKYCWDPYKHTNHLSYEECCTKIDEIVNSGCSMIIFTGGEPTMREDFFDIVDYAYHKGVNDLKICTNGFNLPKVAEKLILSEINEIHISVNKAVEIENRKDFEQYKEIIKCLKYAGKKVVFVSIIDIQNLHNYISVLELAEKLEIIVMFQFMAKPEDRNVLCMSDLDKDTQLKLFKEVEQIHKNYRKVIDPLTFSYYDIAKKYLLYGEIPEFCYADEKYKIMSPDGCISPCYWKEEKDCCIEECFTDKCLVWFRYNKRLEQVYKIMNSRM